MKRRQELVGLSDDHHTALALARRCQQAATSGDADAVKRAWVELRSAFPRVLAPHFRIEERFLLPGLETLGEGTMAAAIRADHAALRRQAADDAGDAEGLAAFATLLEQHVRYEERVVFEQTQDRLPSSVLQAVAAACRDAARARGTSGSP